MNTDRATRDGALADLVVLDLTRNMSGSILTMLLADQGAQVTKLEPPQGDPVRSESGAQVWLRGKRSAVVDLPTDRELILKLAVDADVLVHNWTPAQLLRQGLDDTTLAAANGRLIRCAVTGYGPDTTAADRPDDPWLVAARTGLMWEQRGWRGGAIARMCGSEPNMPDLDPPPGCWDGTDRDGPVYPYTPLTALCAAHLGAIGVTAALHAREVTGRGQLVETSQWQAVLACAWGAWQRVERPESPNYDTWVFDSRATRGMFECADGRWVNHWVPRPSFVLGASSGDELSADAEIRPVHDDPNRILPAPEELVILHHYHPLLREAFLRFPVADWVRVAAELGETLQPVRTPEEALVDPGFLEDGSVITVPDPVLGEVAQAGIGVRLSACPSPAPTPPPPIGSDNDVVRGEAAAPATAPVPVEPPPKQFPPLHGITVLDLGLAVAGPWGTQLLSDLGARVIKINRASDGYWHSSHLAMACNRGKTSLAVDMKKPAGLEIVHQLVARADVVHHNMRMSAATRIGVGYEQLREINPSLIYCHTSGFDDSRRDLPGNDQTGGALAGVLYEDGGCAHGGRPMWSLTSLGDTGNGFLSAFGVLTALHHRDRTGEGQLVTTSIVRAQLLNASYAWLSGDGIPAARTRLDADQLGVSALRRLYPTSDGWLCLALRTDAQWRALCQVADLEDLANDHRLADASGRAGHDAWLWKTLEPVFAARTVTDWLTALDAAGVPCEDASPATPETVFDNPELIERGWVTHYRQGLVGEFDQMGLLFDFSETAARVAGPPLVVGDGTRAILTELGYSAESIDELCRANVIWEAQTHSVHPRSG